MAYSTWAETKQGLFSIDRKRPTIPLYKKDDIHTQSYSITRLLKSAEIEPEAVKRIEITIGVTYIAEAEQAKKGSRYYEHTIKIPVKHK